MRHHHGISGYQPNPRPPGSLALQPQAPSLVKFQILPPYFISTSLSFSFFFLFSFLRTLWQADQEGARKKGRNHKSRKNEKNSVYNDDDDDDDDDDNDDYHMTSGC